MKKFLCFLIIVSICVVSCQDSDNIVSYDFDMYLKNGTYFEETASMVMPSKDSLNNAEIVFYEFQHYSDKILRLIVNYQENDFSLAQKKLNEQHNELKSPLYVKIPLYEKFYFEDRLYCCYIFYNYHNDNLKSYAIAYSISADEKSISYILYESFDLQFMNASDALSLYYGENKIFPVS